ncbi:MAG: hypothetical protein IH984_04945 [Planctomycetes bacterium]|nr:hypothetical protein [Planctomycetota bacterium]
MTKESQQFVSRGGLKLAHALKEFEVDVAGLVCADFGCSTGGFTDCLLQNGAEKVYAIDTGYNVIDYKLRSDDRVVVMERTNALFVVLPWDKNKREKREDPHPSPLPKGEGIRKDPHLAQASRLRRPQPLSQGERGVREDPHPNPLPRGEGIKGEEIRGVDLVTIDLGWTRQQHAIPAALEWLKSDASKPGRIISLIKPHYETNKQEKADWLVDGALPSERAEQVLNRVLSEFPSYGAEVLGCTISPIKGGKSSRKKKGHGNVEYLVLARPITQNH